MITSVLRLARTGPPITRWSGTIGAGLLTWASVVHAIHGLVAYREWEAVRSMEYSYWPPCGGWLVALTDVAPMVAAVGLVATLVAASSIARPSLLAAVDPTVAPLATCVLLATARLA